MTRIETERKKERKMRGNRRRIKSKGERMRNSLLGKRIGSRNRTSRKKERKRKKIGVREKRTREG